MIMMANSHSTLKKSASLLKDGSQKTRYRKTVKSLDN